MARDIKEIRAEIDAVNTQMAQAFCRRMDLAAEVAAYKQEHGLPICDPAREQEILAEVSRLVDEDYRGYAETFFKTLMDLSKDHQLKLTGADAHPHGKE